jgi:hypothetical protein
LLECIIILLLLIEIVGMLLAYLCDNLSWEVGRSGYLLGLCVQSLLQEGLNLDVLFHFIELKELLGHCP